ncbi:histidine phosphatase family protein [Streptococcus pseudoporcinus]|uniref:Phosphoglycerate mutase n=1 Tax=Streptococcus pseudoporcinus TaxID=361101 RepID=A0A4U9XHL8_9STRE|nr:histidine phosphatase family protein [Streptococcus pseudoporcinus]VTS12436.1 phosphoglycerate mutase [Streptococcus pseudoporcinus]VUC64963.1 phosphoglycerate mutase [Streptococcus pseudoporcinus]VUC95588.1 phosphoglycerate mutase [Streptococcus pseudoporcinus]VUC95984.1 phosphoglycerate mutase [Streptococcus pseudoporcinus]
MTTTLYFIRHAEPNYGNYDDLSRELTENGRVASQALIEVFSSIPIDAFYSSPYKRSIDTILPLANSRAKKIIMMNDLRERKLSDEWIEDFDAVAKKQWEAFNFKLPNGESLKEVQERNIKVLHHIISESENQTVVIGTHGTALSTLINAYEPGFGFEEFNAIKPIFPWLVTFEFHDKTLKKISY